MKNTVIVLLFCLFSTIDVYAQEVQVKTFKELTTDISARTHRRYDMNDEACALVKVQFPNNGASFEGFVVGDAEFKSNEYWVYVSPGSKRLKMHLPGYPTIEIEYATYGIPKLESNVTYCIVLNLPSTGVDVSFNSHIGYNVGGCNAASLSFGTFIGKFNIELFAQLPMSESDEVFWMSANSMPVCFDYKPSYAAGMKLGYAVTDNSIYIVPQIGVSYLGLSESAKEETNLSPAKGANSLALMASVVIRYNCGKQFFIYAEPQYKIAAVKSKGWNILSNASSTIKKWNNGFGCEIGVGVSF